MLNGSRRSTFWGINAWLVCSLIIYLFASRRHKGNALSMHPEMDALVASYYASFGGKIDRQQFEVAITQSCKEPTGRGATAIVQVISNTVYVDLDPFTTPHPWDRLRLQHILAMLKRAISRDSMADFEMVVNVHDCPMRGPVVHRVPIFAITRCGGSNVIPLPQWYRWRDGEWGEWNAFIDSAAATSTDAGGGGGERMPKAVFRGAFRPSIIVGHGNQSLSFVNTTKDNWRLHGRTKLLHLQSQHPHLYDVGLFGSRTKEWQRIAEQVQGNREDRLSMVRQARDYKYVVHVEGACGWADRLKVFLVHGAAVLKQDAVCREFFEPLLRPWVHYIPIDNHLNTLTDSIGGLDEEVVDSVRQNARHFAHRHLRPEAWEYYFGKTIRRYAAMWTGEVVLPRPGSKRFVGQVACRPHGRCNDSAAYE